MWLNSVIREGRVMSIGERRLDGGLAPPFRILVVDDDASIGRLLTTKLNLSGFVSRSCGSGE